MESTQTEAPITETPAAPTTPETVNSTPDPFQVDEAVLATLSPESRTAVEPLIQGWKKSALEAIEKERGSFKSVSEKAQALDKLIQDQRFVEWYNQQYNGVKPKDATPPATPEPRKAIITPQEWNLALQKAANGDPSEYEALNRKIAESAVKPTLDNFEKKQKEIQMSIEMDNMFRNHPDARELDSIRIGEKSDAPSLLEMSLFYLHDLQGKPMEEAYKGAKAIEAAIMSKAKQVAMGMVADKKNSVTEGAPTSTKEENIVYADSPEMVLREQIKADMAGKKVQVRLKR